MKDLIFYPVAILLFALGSIFGGVVTFCFMGLVFALCMTDARMAVEELERKIGAELGPTKSL